MHKSKRKTIEIVSFPAKVFTPTPQQYLCGSDIVQFDCIISTIYISIFLSDLSVRFLKCRSFSSRSALFFSPDQWTVILIKLIRSFLCRPWSHTTTFNYIFFSCYLYKLSHLAQPFPTMFVSYYICNCITQEMRCFFHLNSPDLYRIFFFSYC